MPQTDEQKPKGSSAKNSAEYQSGHLLCHELRRGAEAHLGESLQGGGAPQTGTQGNITIPAEQLQAFLQEAKTTGVYEMYYIKLATGLRRGELLGLK